MNDPQIYLVRHATTELNDPDNEKVRGYTDVPIDTRGVMAVEITAKFLRKQQASEEAPNKRILTSPLQRAVMTSEIIASAIGSKIVPNRGLLPWDVGELSGEPIKTVAKDLNYYQEYPDIEVPKGESYRTFYDRWSDCLQRMLDFAERHPDEVVIGVVHSRNLLALPSILEGKSIGDVPVKGGPEPASVTRVYKPNGEWKMEVIHEAKS